MFPPADPGTADVPVQAAPDANVDDVPAVAQHEVHHATVIESHLQLLTD
jgi:hypothetical protein